MDRGVMTVHVFVAAARRRLENDVSYIVDEQEKTYWEASRFTSFCQYSIVRVSVKGSRESPSR